MIYLIPNFKTFFSPKFTQVYQSSPRFSSVHLSVLQFTQFYPSLTQFASVYISLSKYTQVYPSLPEFTSVYQSFSWRMFVVFLKICIRSTNKFDYRQCGDDLGLMDGSNQSCQLLYLILLYLILLFLLLIFLHPHALLSISTQPPRPAPAPSSASHTLSSLGLPCHLSLYENSLTFPWEYPMIAPWEYSDITLWLLRHYPRFLWEPQDYPESFIRIP